MDTLQRETFWCNPKSKFFTILATSDAPEYKISGMTVRQKLS